MAYQPINYASIEPTHGISDLVQSLMRGYQASQAPAQMKRQAEAEELQNQFNAIRNRYAPQRAESELNAEMLGAMLKKKQIEGLEQELAMPQEERFLGKLHGYPAEAFGLALIKQKYGPDSEVYQMAKRRIETEISGKEGLKELREVYAETTPKARATPLAKSNMELEEAREGFVPGTNRTQIIESPERQKQLENQFQLDINKKTSDVDTRKKTLYASNIDKTLNRINVDDLVQYGGIKGQAELRADQLAAATGQTSDRYLRYNEALINSKLLAKQARQFYGDSITPQVQKAIGMMTNPATWKDNPKVAKRIFEALKKTLELETETYRSAQTSPEEYRGHKQTSNFSESDIAHTAAKYGITPEEVRRRLGAR